MGFDANEYYNANKENVLKRQYERKQAKFLKEIEENGWVEGPDYIVCRICGHKGKDLGTHIKTHGMDSKEYKKQYGDDAPIKCQNMCDRIKGANNPGYQHGGKLSVFSDKFVNADPEKKKAAIEKAHNTRVENDSYTTSIEYWLKKTNGNLPEAQRLLSERQTTFSLEICIEKYGKEEGTKRWNDRQKQWLKSYNNKTPEEMMEINRKKSHSNTILASENPNDPCYLYILKISDSLYKIGITTQDVHDRYKDIKVTPVKIFESTIGHCFQMEQLIRKACHKYAITKDDQVGDFGWTETFKIPDIDKLICNVEILNNSPSKTLELFNETFNKCKTILKE